MDWVDRVKHMKLPELKAAYEEMLTNIMYMNPNDKYLAQCQLDIFEVMQQIDVLEGKKIK